MKDPRSAFAALAALGAFTAAASAGERPAAAGATEEWARSAAVLSIGAFDAEHAGQRATEAGVRYRLHRKGWALQPLVGVMGTSAGAVNAYGGLSVELPAGRHLGFRSSFAPGYYTPGHSGKDLGSALEFRSGVELAVRLNGGWRVGIEYYHLSNAGLGRINPGQESLVMTLAVPVGRRR